MTQWTDERWDSFGLYLGVVGLLVGLSMLVLTWTGGCL